MSMSAQPSAPRPPKFGFEALRMLAGYARGLRQRAVVCPVELPDPAPYLTALRAFAEELEPHLPPTPPCHALPDGPARPDAEAFLLGLGQIAGRLQIGAGVPVMDGPRVVQDAQVPDGYHLLLPSFAPRAAGEALAKLMGLFQRHARREEVDWAAALDPVFDALAAHAPPGDNAHVMMMKAAGRGIPVIRRPCGAYHYGWGKHGRLIRGGVDEDTAMLASTVANDKRRTQAMMRAAGLPVAEQHAVADLDAALGHARDMGYPVVLKVNQMELGTGVISDIPDADGLRAAWEELSKHRREMLLEKHVPGIVYRINVVDGQTERVVIRLGAQVTGDGTHTIAELIEITNEDQQRSEARFALLRPLMLDDIALELLDRHHLTPQDVPEAGQVVVLGLKTNRKDRGLSRQVTPEEGIHPDNLALAERAARILRLNIAGVDVLIPDIAVSWRDSGAYICEVNSAPGMGGSSQPVLDLLLDRVPQGGRIPVDVVLGADEEAAQALRDGLADQPGCAVIDAAGMEIIGDGRFDLANTYAATHAALLDGQVTRMVILTERDMVARNGMMLDRADRLWVLGGIPDDTTRAVFGPHVTEMQGVETVAALVAGLG